MVQKARKSLEIDDISFASSSMQSNRMVKQLDLKAIGKRPRDGDKDRRREDV